MSKYKVYTKDYEQTLITVQDIISDGVTTNQQLDRLGSMVFGLDYLSTGGSDQLPNRLISLTFHSTHTRFALPDGQPAYG